MDLSLRCNSLKCRQRLADRAVVTTCSHIFCVPCSDALGLSSSANGVRMCPACDAQLANPDDAVVTQLNPTEDYKTSVLSGVSPTIIMECCSRGISFYQYQVTQEISDQDSMYHDYMAKNLADRYASLNSQMDNVIKDANSEIGGLRAKLERMHMEKKTLEQKNQELINAFSEKSKAHQRLSKLYNRARGEQDARQIRHTAADEVDHVIQSMQGPEFVEGLRDRTPRRSASASGRGGQDLPEVYSHARIGSFNGNKHRTWDSQGSRGGAQSSQFSQNTASSMPGYGLRPPTFGQRQATPNRQPLGEMSRNVTSSQGYGNYSGGGGGVKVGGNMERPPAPIINRNLSRVVHG
ncbi:hypothetical protein E4T39_07127 [Aureobasidium subglaciale]|nr:hypothetical protein E4T39_07127 [Aureobasidium subglaciale]